METEISNLRIELENIKKKRKQLATSIQERQVIEMNLKRALEKCKAIKEAIKDPAEIEKEINEQKQVRLGFLIF